MAVERIGVHESTSIDFPFEVFRDELADLGPELVPIREDGSGADPASCDAFVTFTHQQRLLEADPEWIHTTLAGVEAFPLDEYEARGVVLSNSTGLHGDSVGDTALGLMLTLARRLHDFVAAQQRREWAFPDWDEGFTLPGERVCVVGLGTVGGAVARRCSALGMDVAGVQRSEESVEGVDDLYHPDDLDAAIADARFVVLCVPLTDETDGLIGEPALRRMREEAYLVNVARGPVVDEGALVDALESGEIAGAALDVFEAEPLPEESPLWGFDDVVITPHAAVANEDFYVDVAALVRENFARLEAGEELENRVV
ncbi:D-2-hydroxyacid dehydrogenase [Halobacterium sp. R2-5]|uniref:D-2-hydroxyacid dehydrogenase n=1 Tax=Halobacterium sp. R2-5 TaxID=2715751 RepID=UPI00142449EB|nr:D-2-hydroxyacid dehydrogenase [Halobacterium sp. R2-5]NIC00792.1 D-2-hydroxyacid dehydrogenase [Halobacterium sp. R2-5]